MSEPRFNMQSKTASGDVQSFKESSAIFVDINVSSQFLSGNTQEEQPLQLCMPDLPHAGPAGSDTTRLPFHAVAGCHQDSVGFLRLVSLFENVVPDATRLLLSEVGLCKRALLIKVLFIAFAWHASICITNGHAGLAILGLVSFVDFANDH